MRFQRAWGLRQHRGSGTTSRLGIIAARADRPLHRDRGSTLRVMGTINPCELLVSVARARLSRPRDPRAALAHGPRRTT